MTYPRVPDRDRAASESTRALRRRVDTLATAVGSVAGARAVPVPMYVHPLQNTGVNQATGFAARKMWTSQLRISLPQVSIRFAAGISATAAMSARFEVRYTVYDVPYPQPDGSVVLTAVSDVARDQGGAALRWDVATAGGSVGINGNSEYDGAWVWPAEWSGLLASVELWYWRLSGDTTGSMAAQPRWCQQTTVGDDS